MCAQHLKHLESDWLCGAIQTIGDRFGKKEKKKKRNKLIKTKLMPIVTVLHIQVYVSTAKVHIVSYIHVYVHVWLDRPLLSPLFDGFAPLPGTVECTQSYNK